MKLESVENKPSASFTLEELSLMQKLRRHISTCECCRKAILEVDK
jgi:hypothetical protein